jgi:hypothetical protein
MEDAGIVDVVRVLKVVPTRNLSEVLFVDSIVARRDAMQIFYTRSGHAGYLETNPAL